MNQRCAHVLIVVWARRSAARPTVGRTGPFRARPFSWLGDDRTESSSVSYASCSPGYIYIYIQRWMRNKCRFQKDQNALLAPPSSCNDGRHHGHGRSRLNNRLGSFFSESSCTSFGDVRSLTTTLQTSTWNG